MPTPYWVSSDRPSGGTPPRRSPKSAASTRGRQNRIALGASHRAWTASSASRTSPVRTQTPGSSAGVSVYVCLQRTCGRSDCSKFGAWTKFRQAGRQAARQGRQLTMDVDSKLTGTPTIWSICWREILYDKSQSSCEGKCAWYWINRSSFSAAVGAPTGRRGSMNLGSRNTSCKHIWIYRRRLTSAKGKPEKHIPKHPNQKNR